MLFFFCVLDHEFEKPFTNDHLVREELPVEDIADWGLGKEKITYPKTLPRILCVWCYEALAQRKGSKAQP